MLLYSNTQIYLPTDKKKPVYVGLQENLQCNKHKRELLWEKTKKPSSPLKASL